MEVQQTMEIPKELYYIIGVLVVSNFGALAGLVTFIFKAGKFVANTESGISNAHDAAVRAHKRLDKHLEVSHSPK